MLNRHSWFSRFAAIYKSHRFRLSRRLSGRRNKRAALARLAAWKTERGRFEHLEQRIVLDANEWTWSGDIGPYWNQNNGGDTNWVGDGLPSPGDRLIFGNNSTTQVQNNFAAGSVFALQFDAANYSVNGESITLPSEQTAIAVNSGSHDLGTSFLLTGRTLVDVASGATITLSGELSGVGSLLKTGDGSLSIDGPATYTGTTEIQQGMLDIGRDVQLASISLSPDSTLAFQIDGVDNGSFDRLSVTDSAMLDGTLAIRIAEGFVPTPGDTFEIFSYAETVGSFTGYSGLSYPGGMLLPIETTEGLILVATELPTGLVSIRVDSVSMSGTLRSFSSKMSAMYRSPERSVFWIRRSPEASLFRRSLMPTGKRLSRSRPPTRRCGSMAITKT